MVKFIGEYKAKVDDKGRLIFPSSFKSIIPSEEDMKFVVKKDIFSNCLNVFTYTEWEKESESVKSRLNFFIPEHGAFWRAYMRDRALIEPDNKLGRISIPLHLLESIGVQKEVIFSGSDHKIEIWAKENFAESKISDEEFLNLADQLLA